ncbi:MAG: metallophosphoesterase family protein [Candidatus Kryptoniota bacterium]
MPFKIAHISDTHISPEYNRKNIYRLKSLLSYIVDRNYDHIAITGDITAEGGREELRSVRKLLKYFDLLHFDKVSIVVGNHDIFGGIHRAEDLLSFPRKCRGVNYKKQLSFFHAAFKELYTKGIPNALNPYPYVKFVSQIAFIGINSISPYSHLGNPFGSNGKVDDLQFDGLSKLLSHPTLKNYFKVVLIHHHFNKYEPKPAGIADWLYHRFEAVTLKLHGSGKLLKLFSNEGVNVILHGHTHVIGTYKICDIPFSSTALIPLNNDSKKVHFNELTVFDQNRVTIVPVAVDPQKSHTLESENVPWQN